MVSPETEEHKEAMIDRGCRHHKYSLAKSSLGPVPNENTEHVKVVSLVMPHPSN